MKYLTGQYVEHLGLPTVPLQMPRNQAVHSIERFTGEEMPWLPAGRPTVVVGVCHEGRYYQRDLPGWTWTGYAVPALASER